MTLERSQLILGYCFTPSVFASDEELETYYQLVAKPFLTVAFRFPDVHFTVFFTGPLLHWLQSRHSEYVAVLSEMLKRKQLEVLGGGFFAPLLPLIPSGDRLGQIEELTTVVRKLFGKRPRGLWLTKGVWDPVLVSTIAASGLEFTFLEEREFERLGLPADTAHLPRLTEFQGRLLTIIPFHSRLSAEVATGQLDSFKAWCRQPATSSAGLKGLFQCLEHPEDGRQFSGDLGAFEAFLEAVRSENLAVETVTPTALLKRPMNLERSYFTGTTYEELTSRLGLPAPSRASLQSWKQFLADDPSANSLYNKMVYVNLLVSSLRGDKYKKKSAYEDLWKAQTASGFLGMPGRGDLHAERKKAFGALLNAEVLLRDQNTFTEVLSSQDFDLDGMKEFLFQGQNFNVYVDPVGGQVFEWDHLGRPWNYVGVSGGSGQLQQVFVDRLFRTGAPEADASTFASREYKLVDYNRDRKSFQLLAVDQLEGETGQQPLRLRKTFQFSRDKVEVDYELELLGGPSWEGWFSSELHLTYPEPDLVTCREPQEAGVTSRVVLHDSAQKSLHTWSWSWPARLTSLDGALLPRWWLILHPGEVWKCRVSLELSEAE